MLDEGTNIPNLMSLFNFSVSPETLSSVSAEKRDFISIIPKIIEYYFVSGYTLF